MELVSPSFEQPMRASVDMGTLVLQLLHEIVPDSHLAGC